MKPVLHPLAVKCTVLMICIITLLCILYNGACKFQISNEVGLEVTRSSIGVCGFFVYFVFIFSQKIIFTENIHFSYLILKTFSIEESVKTCNWFWFSSVKKLYPSCNFCHNSQLYRIGIFSTHSVSNLIQVSGVYQLSYIDNDILAFRTQRIIFNAEY